MGIQYKNLREGDLVYTKEDWFSKEPTNIYLLVKPYGMRLFYLAGNDDGKFVFKSLDKNKICAIRRYIGHFNTAEERYKFRQQLIKRHEVSVLENKTETDYFILFEAFQLLGEPWDYLTSPKFTDIDWKE